MQKFHIKKNDIVVVITGSHKGKQGKILEIRSNKNRAVVEGVAMFKKHIKKSEKSPQGGISEREGSIHVSNLMLLSRYEKSGRAQKTAAPAKTAVPAKAPAPAKPKTKTKAKA